MKPKDQLIEDIKDMYSNPPEQRMFKSYAGKQGFKSGWYNALGDVMALFKSFMKGKIIVDEKRAKRWDIIYGWLKENPDYVLVKKGDLFTDKEAETMHQAILIYSPHPKVIDNIAKKLEKNSETWGVKWMR